MANPSTGPAPTSAGRGQPLVRAGLAVALAVAPVVFWDNLYDDFTLLKQASLLLAAALVGLGLALDGLPLPTSRPLRIAIGAWAAMLVVSWGFGFDPLGGLLGVYQYRQGLLTQAAYLLLFLGAASALPRGGGRLAYAPLVGLAGVTAYTAVQAAGRDPVDWWLDTADRAIGTIGNANELAAYAVISLASAGALLTLPPGKRFAATAAVAAAVSFIIFEAESRSGVGALAVFALVFPVAWAVAGAPLRALKAPAASFAAGFAAGALLSLLAGGLAGTAGRVGSGVSAADPGGSTRIELARGTFEVIKARPLGGSGPDGLWLAFPRYRPAGLGGAFADYDLTVQSSHNIVLDLAANTGLPGLAAFGGLVVTALVLAVRRTRSAAIEARPRFAIVVAAAASYGAITMLNPLSLAAHALFMVLLGWMAGRGAPSTSVVPARWRMPVVAATSAVAAALAGVALLLPAADLAHDDGWVAYDARRFEEAAADYRRAGRLMPLERRYADARAEAHLAAAVDGPPSELDRADAAFERLDRRFGFTAGDALGQAAAWIILGRDPHATRALIERALRLNPHGVSMEWYTGQLLSALEAGGTLAYSQRDHWTYIEPDVPAD